MNGIVITCPAFGSEIEPTVAFAASLLGKTDLPTGALGGYDRQR
jgi:hypothetical protein